jgi:sodium-dependent phosphate transporter
MQLESPAVSWYFAYEWLWSLVQMTDPQKFKYDPYVLSLGMSMVNVGSGLWVLVATALYLPVSTTHAVVGAVIGVGFVAWGPDGILWISGTTGGVAGVVMSWFISPVLSGAFSAVFFMTTKKVILEIPDDMTAAQRCLKLMPGYFFFVFGTIWGFLCMKGIPALQNTPYEVTVPLTIGLGFAHMIHGWVAVVPWLRRTVMDKENLPWYTALYAFAVKVGAYGYYEDAGGDAEKGKLEGEAGAAANQVVPLEVTTVSAGNFGARVVPDTVSGKSFGEPADAEAKPTSAFDRMGKMIAPGFYMDVGKKLEKDEAMHACAFQTPPLTDEMFKFLQLSSSCLFSLSHGANDVANAVGPFAAVWAIYETGTVSKKAEVPMWLLIYGGIALDIGLLTMGHQIMMALGNRMTLQTPSRGFCIELGAMFTVMIASRVGIPVSTTHCITGSTFCVGLCNGNMGSVNLSMFAVIFGGWIVTCPCAAIVTGLSLWAVAAAPHPVPQTGMFGIAPADHLWYNYTTFAWKNRTAIAQLYKFDRFATVGKDPVCIEVFNKTTDKSLGMWNCNGGDKYSPKKEWFPSAAQSKV